MGIIHTPSHGYSQKTRWNLSIVPRVLSASQKCDVGYSVPVEPQHSYVQPRTQITHGRPLRHPPSLTPPPRIIPVTQQHVTELQALHMKFLILFKH